MIRQDAILYPAIALAALTFIMLVRMARLRFVAVRRGDIEGAYYRLLRGAQEPDYLARVTRNYHNLLEIPVLFYAVLVIVYASGRSDEIYLVFAWAYVLLRMIHSVIHTTYNRVMHRFNVFVFSNLVLMGLWLRLFVQLLAESAG